jgi:hypothetical protein
MDGDGMSYGCKNRAPLKTRAMVQDGWNYTGDTRTPRMVIIPDPMTKTCNYSLHAQYGDKGCNGCKWKAKNA